MSAKTVLLSNFMLLTVLLLACVSLIPVASSTDLPLNEPIVIAIVESEIYGKITTSLQQYKEDVERSGFLLNITETGKLLNETKEGVKEYIQRVWKLTNRTLRGAVLVGDVPTAWYEVESNMFPTDVYYMDMNGIWMDTNNNGVYDKHLDASGPEIWVGRLKPFSSRGEQVASLTRYFERNHLYRNHLSPIPWYRALLYMDDLGVAQDHDALTPLHYIAPQIVAVTNCTQTNAEDYKQRLRDEVGYQWLYLMSHGNATDHTFQVPTADNYYEWDGTVYSSDYEALDPRVSFYHLFVCSAGRYTEKDYLAGAMVFGSDYGLLAVASTDDTYTYSYNGFYRAMSKGQTIGSAFLQWFKNSSDYYVRRLSTGVSSYNLLSNSQYETLLHSVVLIGDPTLRLHIENHDVRVSGVTAAIVNVSDAERLRVSFTVENGGDFSETFNASVHIDSDLVYRSDLTLVAGGSETVTFFPEEGAKYVWSEFIHHRIRVEVSSSGWEFNVENNVRDEYFVSKIVHRSLLGVLPEVVFAIAGVMLFGMMGWGFLRLLMADRPLYHVRRFLAGLNAWIKAVFLRRA